MPEFSSQFLELFADIEEIGAGGMARVFKANQRAMNRTVAIKLIHPLAVRDTATMQRFLQEARITAKLQHPNIIKILDTGEEADLPYLVFELIEGRTLEDRIRREGPLAIPDALKLAVDVCDALHYAHDHGIIHRDLKPENLLFTRDGVVKIADFGLAKLEDSSRRLTGIGFSVGTPGYMSPEQVLGNETDGRSDVFAVGVMLYEMLTGVLPYPSHNDMNVMLERIQEPYPPLKSRRPEVPDSAEELLTGMLAFEAVDRFQSALEVKQGLEDILKPGKTKRYRRIKPPPKKARPKPAPPRTSAQSNRTPLYVAAAVALVVILAGVGLAVSRRLPAAMGGGSSGLDASGITATPGIRAAYISWASSQPYRAAISIWEDGYPEASARKFEEPSDRTRHGVMVTDLKPGGSLRYRILYPDGSQSLEYKCSLPDVERLELLQTRVMAVDEDAALFLWKTNVPARSALILKRAGGEERIPAGTDYQVNHQARIPDFPIVSGGPALEVECEAAGDSLRKAFPFRSARELATDVLRSAATVDIESIVRQFDSQVRVQRRSADDLIPSQLIRDVSSFGDVAPAWFAKARVDPKLKLYHPLARLESLDAVWAAAGLDLPLRIAAVYSPFIATHYLDSPPQGIRLEWNGRKQIALRSPRAPKGVASLSSTLSSDVPEVLVQRKFRLKKIELDASDRIWIYMQVRNLSVEEHFKIRVNRMLDVYYRPPSVGYPAMRDEQGQPLSEPPAGKLKFYGHGIPAEFFRPGENDLEFTFDSVPGVAPLSYAYIKSVFVSFERGLSSPGQ